MDKSKEVSSHVALARYVCHPDCRIDPSFGPQSRPLCELPSHVTVILANEGAPNVAV